MSWFDIIKLANVGGYIEGGSFEAAIEKLTRDYTAKRITAAEYEEKREALREQFGKMQKANPYTLGGAAPQSLRQQHEEHAAKRIQKPNPKYKCDGCSDTATQECTVCAARFCDDCKEHFPGYHPSKTI